MNKYEITAGLNYLKESTLNEFNPYNEKGERWEDDPEPDKYDASNAKLVTKDGQEVKLPYETVDFRGDPITVIGFTPPHKFSSTGRIKVEGDMTEYFPSVAGLKIVGVIFSDGSVREGLGDMIGKGIHKFIDYLTSARFKNIGGEKPGIEVSKHMSPLVQTSRQVILTFKNGYGISILPEYGLGGRSGLEIIPGSYEAIRLRKAEPGNTKPKGPDNEDGPIIKLKNGDLYVSSGENMRRLDDAELDNVLITTQKAEPIFMKIISPDGLEEAKKPTTNSKHSTEDEDLADEHAGKNHDPKTGKRTKPHPFDPSEEELHEGKMKDIISDAHDMSKEEFYKKYPHGEFDYDEIMREYPLDEAGKPSRPRKGKLVDKETGQEVRLPYETVDFRGDKIVITGYQAPHKWGSSGRIYTDDGDQWSYFPGVAGLKIIDYGPLEEADGSGSYGGQSPLTYQHDDDELNKITKLSGLGEAKRKPRPDDFDDEDDEDTPEDPDKDKVPHILMQIKKAIDVDGDHDIKFEDGEKHKFSITDLNLFLKKYMSMKPLDREKMQEVAIIGKEEFDTILSIINPKKK